MVDPAFFYERNEKGASLFSGGEAEGGEGAGVGVGLDRGGCGEDEDLGWRGWSNRRSFDCGTHDSAVSPFAQDDNLFIFAQNVNRFIFAWWDDICAWLDDNFSIGLGDCGGEGGFGPGLDDSDDRDGEGLLDVGEGEGGGGVAGDDEQVGSLIVEEPCARDGVAGDGLAGLGAVGEAGGVAEIDV